MTHWRDAGPGTLLCPACEDTHPDVPCETPRACPCCRTFEAEGLWHRPCPHGDPTCPCQDVYNGRRDPCHYEGEDPMYCDHCPAVPDCPDCDPSGKLCATCYEEMSAETIGDMMREERDWLGH